MKRACYILTMILFFVSALLIFIPADISPFYGIFCINIFGGLFASIGLTAFIAVLLIAFITRSHFKNGKYKYIVLAVLIVLLICNIICSLESFAATFASTIFTVVLMVLSFLCAKKEEPTGEYRSIPEKIILKIALITLAVIISAVSMIVFMIVFGTIGGAIESEIEMKKYIKSETQTPVSEEIANNFNLKNYKEITSGWIMIDNKTAMLPYGFTTNYKACWIIENDPRFVIRATYDTWDGFECKSLVSKDFDYPNVLTDTVTGIAVINFNYYNDIFDEKECKKMELTPEQTETFRTLAFSAYSENTDKEKIQLNKDDWEFTDYGTIKSKSVYWSYNDVDAIYYSYGEIIKNKDGDYYICIDLSRNYLFDEFTCTFCEKIPDDIALQIDAVFEE